jgi:hypothetical protein
MSFSSRMAASVIDPIHGWPNPPILGPTKRVCRAAAKAGRRHDAIALTHAAAGYYMARLGIEWEWYGLFPVEEPPPDGRYPSPLTVVVSHLLPSRTIARRIGIASPAQIMLVRDVPCEGIARALFDRFDYSLTIGTAIEDNYAPVSVLTKRDIALLQQGRG